MNRRISTQHLILIIIFSLIIGLNSSVYARTTSPDTLDTNALELNKPLLRELKANQSHSYLINLKAKEFIHVVVKQRYIDVHVVLNGPDGKTILDVDTPNETHGLETLSFITEQTGDYQLIVRSTVDYVATGQYEIKLTDRHAATAKDARFIDAQKTMLAATNLFAQQNPEAIKTVLEKYQETLAILQELDLKAEQVNLLDILASINSTSGNQQIALELTQKELPLLQAIGDCEEESQTELLIGDQYIGLKDQEKALEHYNIGLTKARSCKNHALEAISLYALAVLDDNAGKAEKTLDDAHQILSLLDRIEYPIIKVNMLTDIAIFEDKYGDKQQAIKYHNDALALARSINFQQQVAGILTYISDIYQNTGDLEHALEYDKASLETFRLIKNRSGEATALGNTATAYIQLGEAERALDLYNQALKINRELGDHNGEAYDLNNIGFAYKQSEQYEKALEYFNQALPLLRETGDKGAESSELKNIGESYAFLSKPKEALIYLNQALTIQRKINNPDDAALIQASIGFTYDSMKRPQQALRYYLQALAVFHRTYDFDSQIKTLAGMTRVYRMMGNYLKARASIEESIKICEELVQIKNNTLRASYFATLQDNYVAYIDLLMEMHRKRPTAGYNATALQVSESARARSLLEMLAESKADIRQGVDPKLLAREKELQDQINVTAEEQIKVLTGNYPKEQREAVTEELDELTAAYQQLQNELRKNSPRYAALQYPTPLNHKQIQQQVLDQDSVLLEYMLGDTRSFVWVISKNSFKSFPLPNRSEIETAARTVYQLLTARNQRVKAETADQRKARIEAADKDYPAAAAGLSQLILTPIATELGNKRLLIVSEGALQYVPFGALAIPGKESFTPIITEHEAINLPSASMISVLRNEIAGRKPAAKSLVILADPVFEKDDERITTIAIKTDNQSNPNTNQNSNQANQGKTEGETRLLVQEDAIKSAGESGATGEGLKIPRLPGTLQEAEQILALAPAADSKQAIGFAANRELITSNELSQYRIIHFATHGFANSLHPELSGVMLSMFDKAGKPQDGFLRAHEIFNLNLPADLVVLSACQTGLGKDVRGEGLVGLTRGFMYAGAARVVVSLWSVSDKATSELMVKFYEKMLKQNQRPAAALRAAQVELSKSEQWSSPFYWAAFQLQGEWH